jgi:hypothetical protein
MGHWEVMSGWARMEGTNRGQFSPEKDSWDTYSFGRRFLIL